MSGGDAELARAAATPHPTAPDDDTPLDDADFAALMARCAPFERRPRIAVGVSGGRDSMALALLAARWARAQGGSVLALTVDHGLRADSGAEAAQVGRWLAGRGIAHGVLRWDGAKPATGIQEAAARARRALLLQRCRAEGVFHLLLAHQRDDQAETVAMRAARASGADGLAGMALVVETAHARILRPLLPVPRRRLAATLRAVGQGWIDDPSNANPAFLRTRLRQAGTAADAGDIERAGRARVEREAELAGLLAHHVAIHPEGWARVDPALFATAGELGPAALARIVTTIGGGAYAPRGERVARLHAVLAAGMPGHARTLGGCILAPRRGAILVAREAGTVAPAVAAVPGSEVFWDGRFVVALPAGLPAGLRVGALGAAGWRQVVSHCKALRSCAVPPLVRGSLPALWHLDDVLAVPHLFYRRQDQGADSFSAVFMRFRPRHALADAGFLVA
ncbi:MAG: tRNA lysidine(34) synthetase TilS [Alphaproteobacteria bacterium]|nr:tRNA lysidine(34) synthetase TilS [Alphaproteobacteria bacterium]